MQGGGGAALRGPVELLEIDAEGPEELHHLGPQRGASRDGGADAPESELIAQRLEDEPPPDPAQRPQAEGHRLGFQLELGLEHAAREEELRQGALEPVGVFDAHLGLGEDVLPDARGREGHGRPDLAEVLTNGGGILRAIDGAPGEKRHGHREEAVADPRHGQVGHDLVALVERLDLEKAPRGRDEGPVGDHHALGEAGGARGVVDDGEVARPALRQLGVPVPGMTGREGRPPLLDPLEAQEKGIVVVPHALGIVVDHHLDEGQLVLHLEDLVDLLLVLADDHAGLRVVDHVVHLGRDGILVDGHGDAAEGLGGEHGPVELRAIVADDGDLVPAPETQAGQTQGDPLDVGSVVLPGVGLPDSEFLLADGHAMGAPSRSLGQQELGKGVGTLRLDRGHLQGLGGASTDFRRRRSRLAARVTCRSARIFTPTSLESVPIPCPRR